MQAIRANKIANMTQANSQLDNIHTMLNRGQRSLRVEPHTLILWGLAGVFTVLMFELVVHPFFFDVYWQGGLAAAIMFVSVLTIVGTVDFRLTQKIRNQRDESLPFVHRQLRQFTYLLLGLIIASYLGMTFFGGWDISLGIYFSMLGLWFYIYGLFSEKILSWVGVILIALGFVCVAIKLSHIASACLFGSVFGIGFPCLAFILTKPRLHHDDKRRLLTSGAWSIAVLLSTATTFQILTYSYTKLPKISLQEYMEQTPTKARQILRFDAGLALPIQVNLTGDVFEPLETVTVLPATFRQTEKALMVNGKPVLLMPKDNKFWRNPVIDIQGSLKARLTHAEGPVLDYTLNYHAHY